MIKMVNIVCSEDGSLGNTCGVDVRRVYKRDAAFVDFWCVRFPWSDAPYSIYTCGDRLPHVSETAKTLVLPTDKRKARRMLRSLAHVAHNARNYLR